MNKEVKLFMQEQGVLMVNLPTGIDHVCVCKMETKEK